MIFGRTLADLRDRSEINSNGKRTRSPSVATTTDTAQHKRLRTCSNHTGHHPCLNLLPNTVGLALQELGLASTTEEVQDDYL